LTSEVAPSEKVKSSFEQV